MSWEITPVPCLSRVSYILLDGSPFAHSFLTTDGEEPSLTGHQFQMQGLFHLRIFHDINKNGLNSLNKLFAESEL